MLAMLLYVDGDSCLKTAVGICNPEYIEACALEWYLQRESASYTRFGERQWIDHKTIPYEIKRDDVLMRLWICNEHTDWMFEWEKFEIWKEG